MGLDRLSAQYVVDGERQVLVTEVTRMTGGQVCVAALDLHSRTMVRPLSPSGTNWDEAEWVAKGYMLVGNVISLIAAEAGTPVYPHATEDFRVSRVTFLGTSSASDLYEACQETADASEGVLFGGALEEGKYVIAGTHCRSLGCIMMPRGKLKASEFYGKVQISYRDIFGAWHNYPVTELATKSYGDAVAGADALNARLNACSPIKSVALRLGLARAWDGGEKGYDPKRCYLQLNGLILPG